MNAANTTIVIPTRNRPEVVVEMLHYLRDELGWRCSVLVVDQSDDQGAAVSRALRTMRFPVSHLIDHARGTGAARNRGAKAVETAWILFLDDDVRPARDYWEALSTFVEQNAWVDAVQCRTIQHDGWLEYNAGQDEWLERIHGEHRNRTRFPRHWAAAEWFSSGPWGNYSSLTIGTGSGNLLISRRAFFGAGGFDTQIEGLGDDREFGIRLWWYGYRTCFCPHAVAFHLRHPQGGLRGKSDWRHRFFGPDPSPGALYLYLKWMPGHAWREVIAWRLLKHLRRPWSLPVNAFRLLRSINIAKERIAQGPKHLCEPQPREAMEAPLRRLPAKMTSVAAD